MLKPPFDGRMLLARKTFLAKFFLQNEQLIRRFQLSNAVSDLRLETCKSKDEKLMGGAPVRN
jgi:hypothetical protein